MLLRSGLTLEAALQTLEEDTNKAVARFAGGLRSAVSGGDGFAEALERYNQIIEPIYIAMVRAGEASGKLEVVLRAIVQDRTRREQLSQRISGAIRYPLFLVGSALVILFFFLLYVVPQFGRCSRSCAAGSIRALPLRSRCRPGCAPNLNTFLGLHARRCCSAGSSCASRQRGAG